MTKQAFNIAWRVVLANVAFIVLIAGPVFYVLFVDNLLDPAAVFGRMLRPEFGLRALAVLAVLSVFAMLIGRGASRQIQNPFMELAGSIRRIATGDFNVRLVPMRSKEPREMAALTAAFNDMAAALQHSEELRNNLMADVSHELRTPLTVLEGNLRAALDRVYPLDEAEIANLYGQTRHLIRLVNDLHELALAEARRLPLTRQPTDLVELIHETIQAFALAAEERNIALHAATERLPLLDVDAVRMRQVLHNMLNNALQHTPPRGEICVRSAVQDGAATISVSDTGDGLEPEQLHAVFDRFYRADKSRSRGTGGTGLGLAIVSALVSAHGGTVSAASEGRGKGSSFTIRLPLAEATDSGR